MYESKSLKPETMDKCCIVLNPEARTSRKLDVASKIAAIAPQAAVRLTEGPGHAEVLAREAVAQGFDTVVAGGGDGTVNEVLRAITGADVRLGVLPLGTMNVFARELKVPPVSYTHLTLPTIYSV